jgi:CubicO group peptidase (beta-lactamase class C family)
MLPQQLIENSYLARYLLLNRVDITDYEVFASREIRNSPDAFRFAYAENAPSIPPLLDQSIPAVVKNSREESIDSFLARSGTTAFLVLRHGKLLVERYYNGFEHASICTSFSTAKSFVSALVGIALHEGLIGSLDDPLTKYIPEASGSFWPAITIRHLVSMSSGLKYDGSGFFPWNDEPRVYYSPDLRSLALSAQKSESPGTVFRYNNYNLILLGMILERVTGGTVSAYLEAKIWKPLGMEFPASWSLDSRKCGMEKMESGLNACAIDFAKFGQLYLQRGEWNGRQIVPESWVVESTTAVPDAPWKNYKYLWWISRTGHGRFTAVGNLGQFIFIAPDKDCVILRFGRGRPGNWTMVYPQLFGALSDVL